MVAAECSDLYTFVRASKTSQNSAQCSALYHQHTRSDQCLFCCSGRIPRLSLIRYSLYVGVVEKSSSPTTQRGAVRKDGVEIPRVFNVLRGF